MLVVFGSIVMAFIFLHTYAVMAAFRWTYSEGNILMYAPRCVSYIQIYMYQMTAIFHSIFYAAFAAFRWKYTVRVIFYCITHAVIAAFRSKSGEGHISLYTQRCDMHHHHHHHYHHQFLNREGRWGPQMISQTVSSIFPCSPLPSGTWRTPGLSIFWCCLPTSSSVCLVFFPPNCGMMTCEMNNFETEWSLCSALM